MVFNRLFQRYGRYLTRNRKNNKIDFNYCAPVLCRVTIMYATSSTNDSSLLTEAYFVALFQKDGSRDVFSTKIGSLNAYDFHLI